MNRPGLVGLTGGIGSGKSSAAKCFTGLGVKVFDADQITRDLMAPGQPVFEKVIEHFGKDMLTASGLLDRQKLRRYVFSSPSEREQLENLVHPSVYRTLVEQTAEFTNEAYVVWMLPLLLETRSRMDSIETAVDRILVIDCPEDLQIERALTRDTAERNEIERIMQSQISRSERLKQADDVINNEGSPAQLCAAVKKLHQCYQKLFSGMVDRESNQDFTDTTPGSVDKEHNRNSTKH